MSTTARRFIGLLLLFILFGTGFVLIDGGLYGLTFFILLPAVLGGLVAWVFRADDGGASRKIGRPRGDGSARIVIVAGMGRANLHRDGLATGAAARRFRKLADLPGWFFQGDKAQRCMVIAVALRQHHMGRQSSPARLPGD